MRKLMSILGIVCVALSFSVAPAYADIPDPGRRWPPRPRPIPQPVPQPAPSFYAYQVSGPKVLEQADGPITLQYRYKAPYMAKITYKVVTTEGAVVAEGERICKDTVGYLAVKVPRPEEEAGYGLDVSTTCHLTVVPTRFGLKEMDKPVYSSNWQREYVIYLDAQGNTVCEPRI